MPPTAMQCPHRQWFSGFNIYMKHLGILLKMEILRSVGVWDSEFLVRSLRIRCCCQWTTICESRPVGKPCNFSAKREEAWQKIFTSLLWPSSSFFFTLLGILRDAFFFIFSIINTQSSRQICSPSLEEARDLCTLYWAAIGDGLWLLISSDVFD